MKENNLVCEVKVFNKETDKQKSGGVMTLLLEKL
jgi:hypothetical protein